MSFQVGETVGDYEIVGRLGAGGMGEVYKVRNLISDRLEALKVLLPDLQAAPDLAERFIREIKLHASLQHPNIAAIFTALRQTNQLLMLLEFVDGQTIRELLSAGPVPIHRSVDYISQTLCALSYSHGHGVTHRDIKPSNIMVTPQHVVKLMDFGIASKATDNRLTRSGMAMGSVYFMSPEQVAAKPVDGRSDLYSIGVTLFNLVTGRYPFEGDNEYAIMNGHVQGAPTHPAKYNPNVPPALADAILKALEKDPARRFQTALDFRTALEAIPAGTAQTVPPVPPVHNPVTPVATPSTGTLGQAPDPTKLEAARKHLAAYIGPIAGVIVTRAAKKVATLEELYELVAREIPGRDDRDKFLRTVMGSRR